MVKRSTIVIISPQVYPTAHSGTGMRAYHQAIWLSKNSSWVVKVISNTGVWMVEDGVFKKNGLIELKFGSRLVSLLKSVLTGRHYLYEHWRLKEWLLGGMLEADLIIAHYPMFLCELERINYRQKPIVLDTNNNEREYYSTIANASRNFLKRGVILYQAGKSEKLMQRGAKYVDLCVSVSEADAKWAKLVLSDKSKHMIISNNFFNFIPLKWTGELCMLYVGSLHTEMNIQGLLWFRRAIWPHLKLAIPNLKCLIVGRNPVNEIKEMDQIAGIEVHANPIDLKPFYQRAMASFVPALSGSGSKIKVSESLSFGVPVISTNAGLVGQPASLKGVCWNVTDVDQWVGALREIETNCLRQPESLWLTKTKQAVEETSFSIGMKKLAEYIETRLKS